MPHHSNIASTAFEFNRAVAMNRFEIEFVDVKHLCK